MNAIFISYRGGDRSHAARLRDRLASRFGEHTVFFDRGRDRIPPARDFPKVLDSAMLEAEVVIGVVGPEWRSEESLRRFEEDADDFVLRELKRALDRRTHGEALEILPVLVGGASMSGLDKLLPKALFGFARIQALPLRDDPDYAREIEDIFAFIDTHCPGMRARRQNQWLGQLLADEARSRAQVGQNIAVRQAGHLFVRRQAALDALDIWWADWPAQRQAFVMLGEEGDGKSWAVADWLAGRLPDVLFGVPVVFAPANKLSHAGVAEVLAEALQRSLPIESGNWSKNLQALSDGPVTDAPLFLLVLDAFNERPGLPWRELFDTLRVSPWRERVALIGLCRSGYWKDLEIPKDGLANTWTLSPFSDAELDEALASRGARRDQFTAELLHWMARPRYFDLAFRLRDEVAGGGLTLERLIYEDWRDMIGRKQHRVCGHRDFLSLISGLAEEFGRNRFALGAIAEYATEVSASVVELRSELISSGILERKSTGVAFSPRRLPLALGLVLANQVEESEDQSPAALRELIAAHLGAITEADLLVRVCAQALFHALNSRDYSETGRLALLRAWIDGRNLDANDLHSIAAYLPLQPATYLRMAEILWGEIENREAQDAFMLGFLRHRSLPGVRAALRPTFARWLGFVYPEGFRVYYERDAEKLAEAQREVETRLGRGATPGPVTVLGVDLEVIEDSSWLRLSQVALAVISHDRSRDWADALLRGLMAATVMEGSQAEFGWVLHTAEPATAQALINEADRLFALGQEGHDTGYWAARRILMSLGCDVARQRLRHLPEAFQFIHPLTRMQAESPCMSFGWRWTRQNYLDCLERGEYEGGFIARQLELLAINPEITLPAVHRLKLADAGASIDLSMLCQSFGQSSESIDLGHTEPALCAFSPERYAALMSELAHQLPGRTGVSCQSLSTFLLDHVPAMTIDARRAVEEAWRNTLISTVDADKTAQLFLFSAVLFDKSVADQTRLVVARGEKDEILLNRLPELGVLDSDGVATVLETLRRSDGGGGKMALSLFWYLSQTLREPDDFLRAHLLNNLKSYDTNVRAFCFAIVVNTQDKIAARQLIDAGWSAYGDEIRWRERGWGSLMLAELGGELPLPELMRRIAPEWLFEAVKRRGMRRDELDAYVDVLDAVWKRVAELPMSAEVDSLSPYVRVCVAEKDHRHVDHLSATDDGDGFRVTTFTWGGRTATSLSLDILHDLDGDTRINRLNSLAEQIGELVAVEFLRGNPWFGSSFRHGGLDAVVNLPTAPWRKWVAQVLSGDQRARHLLARCGGFYEALCAALLRHAPEDGARLYRVFHEQRNVRISEVRTGLSLLDVALFAAPPSAPVNAILRERLEQATHDADLFDFALLCARGGRDSWLREMAEEGLASDDNFVRARAITLLGFSARTCDGERLRAWSEAQPDCWHRNLAESALERHRRFCWAVHWFSEFLGRPDRVESWAAFRLFLRCVDRRFWHWIDEYELAGVEYRKRSALKMCLSGIESACRTNEKGWKETLFEQKTKPNQVWPWMRDYL